MQGGENRAPIRSLPAFGTTPAYTLTIPHESEHMADRIFLELAGDDSTVE
ncbi:MAG: hypothetical protein ABL860_10080 [Candidatus Nitrotoga sp.]